MPAAVRKGDKCTGHGGFPPRPNSQASANVFINGKGAHRKGDAWESHCEGPVCHKGTSSKGSANVFVNGKALCRVGDPIDCGGTISGGSSNVFVNDRG